MTEEKNISNDELKELQELVLYRYGYDFSQYSKASFVRRVLRFFEVAGVASFYDFKYNLVNNKEFFAFFLENVTVNVTEMFRDPSFYRGLREKVLPALATYPVIKIWHAGCATGEEVFSMCILLEEAGLLSRSIIYATDINPKNLDQAKKGIIPLTAMKEYIQNYHLSGGRQDFSSYYTARYDNVLIKKELRKNIVFSQHNLVTDYAFNEFQLVLCRNVMIYFEKELQNRVMHLFYDSLPSGGYLALGIKESLLFTDVRWKFETVDAASKIFRRKT
ncbi:CheR family methyltransferase [Foetidibacter luteolus]|uniref:CheR family methyltransferase n=1 Tax=Foetidibacter luteolus TaxID=2608880 RepID=UPI00129AE1D0|nr:protein-glutamate O-methyltransferase CheR [Foetidibacter luteolus]